ncbi:MAG TPA: OmpA family protein [Gemmatimonadaceae bacterium]|nr:OmpA family protein [Gemmatimonadaceae bacterium]
MSSTSHFRCPARARVATAAFALACVTTLHAQAAAGTSNTTAVPATAPAGPEAAPGTGAWANYDFVPGSRPLYVNDFSCDAVGDFPKRLRWGQGTFEVVEWQGARFLRATSPGWVAIPLPEMLPEHFTLEFQLSAVGGWNQEVFFGPESRGARQPHLVLSQARSGVIVGTEQTLSAPSQSYRGAVFPVRVHVDGSHAKVYMGETRVANIPTIDLGRAREIRIQVRAQQGAPVLIGDVRVMAGGKDLYDALANGGRVATQGILFATGSAVVRVESTPTLREIAAMLSEHSDLQLSIEGHTDGVGDAAANLTLSERRAAAVRSVLVERFGVDAARLESKGLGATVPAQPNTTAEGRHANRRVELVKR